MKWLSNSLARNLILGVVFILIVCSLAVLAYMHNGWSFGDALYMTVLTIYTVGYGEVHPVNTFELRAITIALMVLGCTGMIYLTAALVQFITLSQIQQLLGLTRMNKQIDDLHDHVVICGFGRTGSMLARELKAGKAQFVIIEPDHDRYVEAKELGYLVIHGDAAEEAVLKQAGIERARALATVVASDPANVFVTLSARALNSEVQIIARGEEPSTEKKLFQAGASAVVLPAHVGAEQIASMILFPSISSVIQSAERRRQMELDLTHARARDRDCRRGRRQRVRGIDGGGDRAQGRAQLLHYRGGAGGQRQGGAPAALDARQSGRRRHHHGKKRARQYPQQICRGGALEGNRCDNFGAHRSTIMQRIANSPCRKATGWTDLQNVS